MVVPRRVVRKKFVKKTIRRPIRTPEAPESVEYGDNLSYGEVVGKYQEVKGTYQQVLKRYSGLRIGMKAEDRDVLNECVGILLPLAHQKSIQDKCKEGDYTDIQNITRTMQNILLFQSEFDNTGVEKIGYVPREFGF